MPATVSSLIYYPLKSGKGIQTSFMEVTERGPRNDRMWMLVDSETGVQITQRDRGCEKMALIETQVLDNKAVRFSAPGMRPFIQEDSAPLMYNDVSVHGDVFTAGFEGHAASDWFKEYLGRPCHLVSYQKHPSKARKVDPEYSHDGDIVSFADGFPLLVTSTPSFDSLSGHFPENANIDMGNFRPNIVIDGVDAFEEDVIHHIRIGKVELEFVKPSSRCVLTTVNQTTGEKPAQGNEPMGTLVKQRRGKGDGLQGVFFGQNAIPRQLGTIMVGDEVEILSKREMHPAVAMANLRYQP